MSKTKSQDLNVAVFVMGESGRSPRMQYHTLSISKLPNVSKVYLIGLRGPACHPQLYAQKNISFLEIDPGLWDWIPLRIMGMLSFMLLAWIKVLLQITSLFYFFAFKVPAVDVLLIQTPPAIPTLFIVQSLRYLIFWKYWNLKLMIDWHNFGYTLLNPENQHKNSTKRTGKLKKIFLSLAYFLEYFFGTKFPFVTAHFCVSNAMKKFLKEKWGLEATVLYDRPPDSIFKNLDTLERSMLLSRLLPVSNLANSPNLVVSSTSWTPDEDFSVLLDAVVDLDKKIASKFGKDQSKAPHFQFIITGKGPQKQFYEQEIHRIQEEEKILSYCRIDLMWLKSEDYPKLLGCCDLGVCLHYSSSGLDLPMKVVDMFGAGVPVCAIDFEALPELVQEGKNGMIFKTSQELSQEMFDLFCFEEGKRKLEAMRDNLKKNFQTHRWDDEWKSKVEPFFLKINSLKTKTE